MTRFCAHYTCFTLHYIIIASTYGSMRICVPINDVLTKTQRHKKTRKDYKTEKDSMLKRPERIKRLKDSDSYLRSRILRKHDLEIEEICCANDRFLLKVTPRLRAESNNLKESPGRRVSLNGAPVAVIAAQTLSQRRK